MRMRMKIMDEEDELIHLEQDRQYVNQLAQDLVGKSHTFEDGDSIAIIQVKSRGPEQHFVTYHVQQGPGIARKMVMPAHEFLGTYGHLFGREE